MNLFLRGEKGINSMCHMVCLVKRRDKLNRSCEVVRRVVLVRETREREREKYHRRSVNSAVLLIIRL
ncbi:hypothetical protein Hdeb2414_s0086g00785191 [Helianthus debilis subsp. tardiflorus]